MDFTDLHLATTDSTNRVARQLGQGGAAQGSAVVADSQTSGRGRLGRAWFSPAGTNLYCSYIARPDIELEDYPKLTMVAGVAVAQCLKNFGGIDIGLKWPNDLFIGSRKCGGILSEFSTDQNDKPFAVIGIGINCNLTESEIPDDLSAIATSLLIESGSAVDIMQLFNDVRISLLYLINEFESSGFSEILERWHRFDIYRGKKMSWARPDGTEVQGVNLGPDRDGALMVKDTDGTIHHVVSGEVTFTGLLDR